MNDLRRIINFFVFALTLAACAAPVNSPAETSTPVSTQTNPPALMQTSLPVLTFTAPTPSATPISGWRGALKARLPDHQEINVDSVWVVNLIDVKDVYVPGIESYAGEVQVDREYAFPAYWCARNPKTLFENMEAVSTQLTVNGETVPDEYILTYDYADDTSWHCNYRSVILSGWKANAKYTLEIRRTLSTQVFDGKFSYEPGMYIARLVLTVH